MTVLNSQEFVLQRIKSVGFKLVKRGTDFMLLCLMGISIYLILLVHLHFRFINWL